MNPELEAYEKILNAWKEIFKKSVDEALKAAEQRLIQEGEE